MGVALSDMEISSPSFESGSEIPRRFTQYGDNISPELRWKRVPEGTKSFAVFLYDADAPVVLPDAFFGAYHWIAYNIPASATLLPEGGGSELTAGTNMLGNAGYDGPMPPPGHGTHTYVFWLLALAREPDLEPGLDLPTFLRTVEPYLIGMNRVVATARADD